MTRDNQIDALWSAALIMVTIAAIVSDPTASNFWLWRVSLFLGWMACVLAFWKLLDIFAR